MLIVLDLLGELVGTIFFYLTMTSSRMHFSVGCVDESTNHVSNTEKYMRTNFVPGKGGGQGQIQIRDISFRKPVFNSNKLIRLVGSAAGFWKEMGWGNRIIKSNTIKQQIFTVLLFLLYSRYYHRPWKLITMISPHIAYLWMTPWLTVKICDSELLQGVSPANINDLENLQFYSILNANDY
jgi:hypothetical protein